MHFTRTLILVAGLVFASAALNAQAVSSDALERASALSEAQIRASSDAQSLGRLAAIYAQSGDRERYRWTLARLVDLVPGLLPLKLDLVASYAADDMKTQAYDVLLGMKGQGFGVDLASDPRFTKLHGTEAWKYIVDSLKANLEPFGEGKLAFELPAADLLIDALAWDAKRVELLAGSARNGGVYRIDANGKLKDFIKADARNQLYAVLALAADAKRNRLWVASTSVPHFKGYAPVNAGKAALVEFELGSGKFIARHALESAGTVFLSSLALAPDGTVYAADGVNKIIYTLAKGKLVQLAANPHLNDIRAIAVNGDGTRLYMADTIYGIVGYDLVAKSAFGLRYNAAGLVLPGITDLAWYDGTLILVEPGMHPARVMRLTLSEDGRSVTKAMPLDVAQPDFALIDAGTLADDAFYFIANSQREKYDAHGLLRDGATLEPVRIWRSNPRYAWNEGGVNLGLQRVPVADPETAKKLREKP